MGGEGEEARKEGMEGEKEDRGGEREEGSEEGSRERRERREGAKGGSEGRKRREGAREEREGTWRGLTFAGSEEGGCVIGPAWMQPSGYDASGTCAYLRLAGSTSEIRRWTRREGAGARLPAQAARGPLRQDAPARTAD